MAQSLEMTFTTRSFSTGIRQNADALPVVTLLVGGADSSSVVTVANVATGRYKATVTLPGIPLGSMVEMFIVAVVGGVTDNRAVLVGSGTIVIDDAGEVQVYP